MAPNTPRARRVIKTRMALHHRVDLSVEGRTDQWKGAAGAELAELVSNEFRRLLGNASAKHHFAGIWAP